MDKIHVIIIIDAEKGFDNIQHSHDENNKLRMEVKLGLNTVMMTILPQINLWIQCSPYQNLSKHPPPGRWHLWKTHRPHHITGERFRPQMRKKIKNKGVCSCYNFRCHWRF